MRTGTKGFSEWGEIFGDETMAAAVIDRLLHHCHIVAIRSNIYRMRQHRSLPMRRTASDAGRRSARRTER